MKQRIMMGTLGLLVTLIVASCGSSNHEESDQPQVTLDSGSAVDTGTIEGKINQVTELLRFGPKNWELWAKRSKLYYEGGNIPRAMADIEKAIANSIDEPEAYYLRGFYYYAQKEDSAAMRDFKRAANLNSTNPETYHLIGNLCLLKGEYARADVAYDHAIRLDSMEPTYYLAKGILREKQQKIREAIEWYETSLKRNPAFIKGLLALHDVHLTKGRDPDQAYLYNERVMLIDSTQPLAHFNQGNFMIARANRITDSSKLPDFRALVNVAISEYGLALRYDPEFVQARYNRGYAYYLLEKYGQAFAEFTRVTELDPFHRDAFYMKANIQEFQGDLNGALENYRRSFEIDPKFSDAASAVKELSFRLKNQ